MKIRQYVTTIIFIIYLFLISAQPNKAQIIQFSQFYSSPLTLAPSFAGMSKGSRIALTYRDQWPNLPGTFVTMGSSFDHYLRDLKSGVGVVFLRDRAGTGNLSLTSVGLVYSYDIKLNRFWHLRPGVQFKYAQRSLEFNKLIFGDQLTLDPNGSAPPSIEMPPDNRKGYVDATTSVIAFNDQYWGGVTVDHLFHPNQSLLGEESRVPFKVSVYGGAKIFLDKRHSYRRGRRGNDPREQSITLTFLYKTMSRYDQLDLGAYYYKNPLMLGVWIRGMPVIREGLENRDAVVFMIGYKANNLSIGYSYDFTISQLIGATGGSHEISIIYEFNLNSEIEGRRRRAQIPCPMF